MPLYGELYILKGEHNMKKKRIILKKVLIGTGTCVGCLVMYGIGYDAGCRDTSRAISNGIDKLWKANPELKDIMWEGLKKIKN